MIDFNETNLSPALDAGYLVLDFWASWCPPCRATMPLFSKFSENHSGKATFGKVNIDEQYGIAERYKVGSIPTVIVIKDGQEVKRFVGMPTEKDLLGVLSA